jgi:N-formylglutamate deformylase
MTLKTYSYTEGKVPLLVSMPHPGIALPENLMPRFTPAALTMPDADWHIPRLYDFVHELGAYTISANYSRYLIDLNRAPDDASLYPGKFTTGLCPTTRFNGAKLYYAGQEPQEEERERRKLLFWQPYHDRLAATIEEMKTHFPRIVVVDAHSIVSNAPLLFEGELPAINLGTADGSSCAKEMEELAVHAAISTGYSWVLNGRFKGGYITRHYGKPEEGVHALQIELAQCYYMQEEHPYGYQPDLARKLQTGLRHILTRLLEWAEAAG